MMLYIKFKIMYNCRTEGKTVKNNGRKKLYKILFLMLFSAFILLGANSPVYASATNVTIKSDMDTTVVLTNSADKQYVGIATAGQNLMFANLDYDTYTVSCINPLNVEFTGTDATQNQFTLSSAKTSATVTVYNKTTVKSGFYIIDQKNNIMKTQDATVPTPYLTDGLGQSIPFDTNAFNPLGPTIGMTGYNAWPSGFTKGSSAFCGGIYDSSTKNIWMVPYAADRVVTINTQTGQMASNNNWPSGITGVGAAGAFSGGAATSTDVWLIPNNSNMLVKINKATGEMTGYNTWPTGFAKGSSSFIGGVLVGTDLWLTPYNSNIIVKVDTLTGNMTGYNAWPAGFTAGSGAFQSAVYDGKYIWYIPSHASMVVRLNPQDGTMTGYNSFPTDLTGLGNFTFQGGTFDGTNIWMAPNNAKAL